MAFSGLAVLEEVIVFQAEFPGSEQSSSSVVALLAFVHLFTAGATSNCTCSAWPGYGSAIASAGLPVLAEVIVFQAEFPGSEHDSSTVVALLALVQMLASGRVYPLRPS